MFTKKFTRKSSSQKFAIDKIKWLKNIKIRILYINFIEFLLIEILIKLTNKK